MVKNSFIEKTYVVGTTYVTDNYLDIYTCQVSCPLPLPLLNLPICQ